MSSWNSSKVLLIENLLLTKKKGKLKCQDMNYRLSFLIVYLLSSLDSGNIASFGIAIKEARTLQNLWHVHV